MYDADTWTIQCTHICIPRMKFNDLKQYKCSVDTPFPMTIIT